MSRVYFEVEVGVLVAAVLLLTCNVSGQLLTCQTLEGGAVVATVDF